LSVYAFRDFKKNAKNLALGQEFRERRKELRRQSHDMPPYGNARLQETCRYRLALISPRLAEEE
jgi:hypothetical protein